MLRGLDEGLRPCLPGRPPSLPGLKHAALGNTHSGPFPPSPPRDAPRHTRSPVSAHTWLGGRGLRAPSCARPTFRSEHSSDAEGLPTATRMSFVNLSMFPA